MAVETVGGVIHPHDLAGKQARDQFLFFLAARHHGRIAGLRRIHVVIPHHAVRIQVWIDLQDFRLRIGIAIRARHRQAVVEEQQVTGTGESVLDPLDIVVTTHLFVAGVCLQRPVLLGEMRVFALTVDCGIPETIQKVACLAGREAQTFLGVARHKGAVVVDDVDFVRTVRTDRQMTGFRVVVDAVQVNIVTRKHAEVYVQPARKIGKAAAFTHVVRGIGMTILHQVIGKSVFPDHVAVAVHFDDGIQLGALVTIHGIGVGPQRNDLVVCQVDVGDVEKRVVPEFRVVYPQEIMVRMIGLAGFGVLPQDLSVPVHLGERRRPPGTEHRAVLEQVRVGEARPVVHHLPRHIHQVGPSYVRDPRPDEEIPGISLLRIPVDQFGRPP